MIEPNAKIIELNKGEKVYVSPARFDEISKFSWFAKFGHKNFSPYAARSIRQNSNVITVWMHRFIVNAAPGQVVDHVDGNTLNNCDSNLKITTKSENFKKRWSPCKKQE
jgi:hypothetical protein